MSWTRSITTPYIRSDKPAAAPTRYPRSLPISGESDVTLLQFPRIKFNNAGFKGFDGTVNAVVQSVRESPGVLFNPLIIFGDHGSGKSYLLQMLAATSAESRNEHEPDRVLHISALQFKSSLTAARRSRTEHRFRAYIVGFTSIFIDHFDAIDGDFVLQLELFSLLNHVRAGRGQIALAGLVPVAKLIKIDPALLEFFRSGYSLELKPPDIERRIELLKALANRYKQQLDDAAARLLATHVEPNAAALEGMLSQTIARARVEKNEQITAEIARAVLTEAGILRVLESNPITISEIALACAQSFNRSLEDLCSEKRESKIVRSRHLAMHLAKELTGESAAEIGKFFGNRDYSSVSHALESVDEQLAANPELRNMREAIRQKLNRPQQHLNLDLNRKSEEIQRGSEK